MSLRARLIAVILIALFASFTTGAVLASLHAARLVRLELSAALESESAAARAALANADIQGGALPRVVRSFDTSRHLRAVWTGPGGRVLAQSRPTRSAAPAPTWFAAITAPALAPVTIPLADGSTLRLEAKSADEIGERWVGLRDAITLLGLFCLLTLALCWLTVSRALRPLSTIAHGFARLGRGERQLSIAAGGPPEIADLAAGFNRMSLALDAAEARSRVLGEQIVRAAEEERGEIARDLHDEIGPLLFAITAFTATARQRIGQGSPDQARAPLASVDATVAELQGVVRDLLARLHAPEPLALPQALDSLLRFWHEVRPETEFLLAIEADPAGLAEPARETLFRVAQEGVTNAVRHGNPSRVEIAFRREHDRLCLTVHDDGSAGEAGAGFGLTAMRERLASLGGSLEVSRAAGWTLTAAIPAAAA